MNVDVDMTGWFVQFQSELDALLSDMFQIRSATEQKRYTGSQVNQAGIVGVVIPNAEALGETAPRRAAQNAFIGAMSKFSGFLDRLIASRRIATDGIPVTRDLHTEAEVIQYVSEIMEEIVADVAHDPKLSVPKLDLFPGIDSNIKAMALNYNALRNALEHHHDLPKREITVTIRRIVPMVGEQEITQFPVLVRKGETMSVKMIEVEKTFPANQKVVLEPEDGHDLIFTVRHVIAPSIFQWHVGIGNPKSVSDPLP